MEAFDYPPESFCASSENRIDYQTDGKCAAYAAAYLLRHFGEDTGGEALFPELKRTLGFVSANSIVDVFEQHGYQAKACHGSIDTLKQRLSGGNPIIVFTQIPGLNTNLLPEYDLYEARALRYAHPQPLSFAVITGHQLYQWYKSRQYYGCCGHAMKHDTNERMMYCPDCSQHEYPVLMPAVIVAITNGNKILLSKYEGRGLKQYALIAGFAEIGETIEETVHREVMEEVIAKVNEAIDWAEQKGLWIVYIQHNNLSAGTRTFKPGTRGAELVAELNVVSDHIFTKVKSNALTSEAFTAFIQERGISEFYVVGADAAVCIKSTCYNMTKCGYTVHVLSDCITSYDKKKLPELLTYYESKGCEVLELSEVVKR